MQPLKRGLLTGRRYGKRCDGFDGAFGRYPDPKKGNKRFYALLVCILSVYAKVSGWRERWCTCSGLLEQRLLWIGRSAAFLSADVALQGWEKKYSFFFNNHEDYGVENPFKCLKRCVSEKNKKNLFKYKSKTKVVLQQSCWVWLWPLRYQPMLHLTFWTTTEPNLEQEEGRASVVVMLVKAAATVGQWPLNHSTYKLTGDL